MPVTRTTVALVRRLRRDVGVEVDATARALTAAWMAAWRRLTPAWTVAAADLVAERARLGHWPRPTDLARLTRVMSALAATEDTLDALTGTVRSTATSAADRVIDLDVDLEPRIVASQAPDTQAEALHRYLTREQDDRSTVGLQVSTRIRTDAVNVIRRRAEGQITALSVPLSSDAVAVMRRELIRGIDVGANPREAAARMVARAEGGFNGGLTRALVISRTEILDAYRQTSHQIHNANSDVVTGWQWWAELDRRCCPSCWSMHGREFPTAAPGPDDHQQGRCTRLPVLAPWSQLGITTPEPPAETVDARSRFLSLPQAAQVAVMGPARLALLLSGRIGWTDLAFQRVTRGWRPSFAPTPVAVLARLAAAPDEP